MNKIQRRSMFPLTIVLLLSLLLVSAQTALAAEPFTLIGELDITGEVYSVDAQEFSIAPTAVCSDAAGLPMDCADLADGMLVEVKGTFEGADYTATAVAVLSEYAGELTALDPLTVDAMVFTTNDDTVFPPFYAVGDTVNVIYKVVGTENLAMIVEFVAPGEGSTYTYTGAIVAFSDIQWTVGDYDFIVDSATTLPVFYAVNDTVEVTFEMTAEGFKALDIALIASHPDSRYIYEGTLTAFDDTTWTVGDYTFNMTEVDLPIYFGVGDVVKLEFRMEGELMEFYATQILELQTYVPPKTESDRCAVVRDHPGVQKVAMEVGADYEDIWNLFCKGFGLGEIRLAYKHAEGSEYTPEMLLALRAQGYGWGELKKMAKDNPPSEAEDGTAISSENGKNREKALPPGLAKKLGTQDEEATGVGSETETDRPGNSENAPGQNKVKDNNGKGKNK